MTHLSINEDGSEIDVGVVVVHYHNTSEVARFLRSLERASMPERRRRRIVIVNNGGTVPKSIEGLRGTLLVRPKENLGYLNGCARGINAFRDRFGEDPTWWIVSNTDLCFEASFFHRLMRSEWSDKVGVLAPDIREEGAWPCNPFLKRRPSSAWIRRRLQIFSIPFLSLPYQVAARVKRKWTSPESIPFTPQRIYAPHGCLMVVHRRFFQHGGRLAYGGFLFGEEIHVAEQIHRCTLEVRWSPSLCAWHRGKRSMEEVSLRRRAKFARESLTFLYQRYFNSK